MVLYNVGSSFASITGTKQTKLESETPMMTPEPMMTPAPIKKDILQSEVPKKTEQDFIEKKNYGADLFKNYAMNNVTVDDIDMQLNDISNKKITAYVELTKYFKEHGENVSPDKIMQYSDSFKKQLDDQASILVKEKNERLDKAGKDAEIEYQTKSIDFINAKNKQKGIELQIQEESNKPQSDPIKISELMEQKVQIDTKVDKIKKDFAKKGINEPDAIIREGDTIKEEIDDLTSRGATKEEVRSIMNKKYPDKAIQIEEATVGGGDMNISNVLYNTALGQYDNESGNFNDKKFLADTQKIPEYKGLSTKQIGEKLIEEDDDTASLGDIFYVSTQLKSDPKVIVQKLIDKDLSEEEIVDIVINGYARNVPNIKTQVGADKVLKDLKGILKEYGIKRSIINDALQPRRDYIEG